MSSPLPLQRNLSHYLSPPFYFIFLFSLLFLSFCLFLPLHLAIYPPIRISHFSFLSPFATPTLSPLIAVSFPEYHFFFHATSFSLFHRTFLRYFSLYRIFLRKKPFSTAFDDPHLPHPSNEALPPSLPFFLSLHLSPLLLRYFHAFSIPKKYLYETRLFFSLYLHQVHFYSRPRFSRPILSLEVKFSYFYTRFKCNSPCFNDWRNLN